MSTSEHAFTLTTKQTAKLQAVLDTFYGRALGSKAIPGSMLLLLGGVRSAIMEEQPLEQHQTDVALWVMDLVFSQMGENEYDPQMEQVYHKLAGWWPITPPWFERTKDEPKSE